MYMYRKDRSRIEVTEDEEESVSSYWMTLKKLEGNIN